jgi:tRNA-splicing ligase RtcB (3'-phosphate/5'-hydroxy nucleic acid ligase)
MLPQPKRTAPWLVQTQYARANRDRLLGLALEVLFDVSRIEIDGQPPIDCMHNFVRAESIGSQSRWIHRKGALSAREGELGIIPGSMGTESYLVEGRGNPLGLFSSSHGAGRVLSRGEACRRIDVKRLRQEMHQVTFAVEQAHLLRDEAPSAYKPIAEVMRAQRVLTRIICRLRPWVVYKGT